MNKLVLEEPCIKCQEEPATKTSTEPQNGNYEILDRVCL